MVIKWVYDRPLLNKDRNWSSILHNREIYQQWWWQRERQTSNKFTEQNIKFAPYVMLFCTFLSRYCTTRTWKCLLSHYMEDVNKWWPIFLSLSKLEYSPQEINLQGNLPTLDIFSELEYTQQSLKKANSFLKWRFRCCWC